MQYTINGVSVDFPFKAYPGQIAMMSRIIQALNNKEHALLESPTGTGKSLTLLCAALSWQRDFKKKNEEIKLKQEMEFAETVQKITVEAETKSKYFTSPEFQSLLGKEKKEENKKHLDIAYENNVPALEASVGKNPKIYFGTRTHKQISQIIRELKRTKKYQPKMAILASRNHYCIHSSLNNIANKNDECKKLLKARKVELETGPDPKKKKQESCAYNEQVHILKGIFTPNFYDPKQQNYWDMEDFVKKGIENNACPYFTAKLLAQSADIIFCPYNYLIDPSIRKSMEIELEGNIFILDEAHNIEDVSRSSASFEISDVELNEARNNYESLSTMLILQDPSGLENLKTFVANVKKMAEEAVEGSEINKEFGKEIYSWTGDSMISTLHENGIHEISVQNMKNTIQQITQEIQKLPNFNFPMLHFDRVSNFLYLLELIFTEEKRKFDFHLVCIQNKQSEEEAVWKAKVGFWCHNPGVIFHSLSQKARSVILASGTLSPMDSFASELQTPFKQIFEGPHVIAPSRVWTGVIEGGRDAPFLGTFQYTEKSTYQDDLGRTILKLIQMIPMGCLCFLPSYSLLDKLIDRWSHTDTLDKMQITKRIFIEPRNTREFDECIQSYYQTIQSGNGALFFGVYRGKISEGIDFANDYARAVIAIGIPFPNFKDIQVNFKKQYNERFSQQNGILSGSRWYKIQAFRAYNQALGRCIRHKEDYGAIIMLDTRLSQQGHQASLSKWLRSRMQSFTTIDHATSSLSAFYKQHQPVEESKLAVITEIADKEDENVYKRKIVEKDYIKRDSKKYLKKNHIEGFNKMFGNAKRE